MATLSEKEMELLGSALSSIKGGKAAFMKSVRHLLIAAYVCCCLISIVPLSAAESRTD